MALEQFDPILSYKRKKKKKVPVLTKPMPKIKPRLYKYCGFWYCIGDSLKSWGETPFAAWNEWCNARMVKYLGR